MRFERKTHKISAKSECAYIYGSHFPATYVFPITGVCEKIVCYSPKKNPKSKNQKSKSKNQKPRTKTKKKKRNPKPKTKNQKSKQKTKNQEPKTKTKNHNQKIKPKTKNQIGASDWSKFTKINLFNGVPSI